MRRFWITRAFGVAGISWGMLLGTMEWGTRVILSVVGVKENRKKMGYSTNTEDMVSMLGQVGTLEWYHAQGREGWESQKSSLHQCWNVLGTQKWSLQLTHKTTLLLLCDIWGANECFPSILTNLAAKCKQSKEEVRKEKRGKSKGGKTGYEQLVTYTEW